MLIDEHAVAAQWRTRGVSCDKWIDLPGQEWRDFVHAVDGLVMLVEGEIELRFAGKCLRPPPGEAVLIPAGESHTVINTGTTTNTWLYGYRR